MDKNKIATKRTLIIRKPQLNKFELYREDPRFTINKIAEEGALKQFMSHNPLPYYIAGKSEIEGGGFWSDFAHGFEEGFTKTLEIGSKILPFVGLGKKKGGKKKKVIESSDSEQEEEEHEKVHEQHEINETKKLTKIEHLAQDMKKQNKKILRGEMIRKLMKERGMKLGEASRYIKENKLM